MAARNLELRENLGPRPKPGQEKAAHPPITVVIAGEAHVGKWDPGRALSRDRGFVVVGCAEALEALACARRLAPCVAIVPPAGIEAMDPADFGNSVGFGRKVRVLVPVETEDREMLENLLSMGCAGYLTGRPTPATLRRAVRAVAAGELWASRKLLAGIVQSLVEAGSPRKLTRREKEILKLIALGYKNREIAEELFISRETVRWHMRSLYGKIGVEDRLSAAFYAWEHLAEECNLTAGTPKRPPDSVRHSDALASAAV